MNRAQFCRRPHVRLALIANDFVGEPKFLEQPQHALGAGIVEGMDGEHGEFPQRVLAFIGDWRRWCPRSSGRRGWRLAGIGTRQYIARAILTYQFTRV